MAGLRVWLRIIVSEAQRLLYFVEDGCPHLVAYAITPMISALNHIARVNPTRHVIFGHAARSAEHHAHRADVAAAQAVMPNLQTVTFYESEQGLMEAAKLPEWPREEANVYMCGPTGFMRAQWAGLLEAGVPVVRLHREVFGPDLLDI